jgi:uroporphyrinogen decarboxylase
MDAKERILKAFNHEEADRVPYWEASIDNLEICKYYGSKYTFQGIGFLLKWGNRIAFGNPKRLTKIAHKFTRRKIFIRSGLKRIAKLYKDVGIDFAITPLALFPVQYDKYGWVDDYARRFEIKEVPGENIDFGYYSGGVLKNFEDYEEFYQQYPLDPDDPYRKNNFLISKEVQENANGKLYFMPAIIGMMEATWEGFGLENFSRLLARRKQIKKIFDDRGKFAVELTKRILEWGETGAMLIFDDYGYKAGLFMSPRNYREYVMPWLKKICDTAHKGGVKVLLHSCGDINMILEDIIKAGVDALHPIEPTTANPEYDIFKLKEKYGDQICLVGNVSPQDLSDKTPEDIREYTKKLLKYVAPGGGFILSSGHSINPAIKLDNYLAMKETHEKYGKYPIQIN